MGRKTHEHSGDADKEKTADNMDKTSNRTTDGKTPTTQERPAREPARPCRHCNGKHWDIDCPKKPRRVNAVEIDHLDEEDIQLLEEIASDTMSEASNYS
ncbi:hypothetical protein CNMCM5623_009241 [Aspergillus felis]|uniref:Uncharacterized protein n=1 Tax=Aspergillus felis TaxID=1287682 RepID=A0A8H6PKR8_9EURO|nr:hypothetical protein CNMCM5623_009241 [Aspergillus felis]KAF7175272.1 hypothetical protein CNMCM7691_007312 [Aspergillus felis]